MASLWENLIGRRERPVPASRPPAPVAVRGLVSTPVRRYLAVVDRTRPDLLLRVNRLFFADGNVDAVLDRRYGDRRRLRAVGRDVPERRQGERRQLREIDADLGAGPVVIVEVGGTAIPERFRRWIAAGQDALGALDRAMGELAAAEREVEALREAAGDLRAENERLCAENAALRAQAAATSRGLAELAERIVRPLGEIVHRLRTP